MAGRYREIENTKMTQAKGTRRAYSQGVAIDHLVIAADRSKNQGGRPTGTMEQKGRRAEQS